MSLEKLWYKSYAPDVPNEIDFETITMPDVLERTARDFPGNIAFLYMGTKISFRDLDRLVNRFARALAGLGVKPGDKVGMLLPNIPQIVIANYASHKIGAVTVMNNPLYTERELEYQLNDSDSKILIALDLLLPRALKLREKTGIENIITCHINDYLPFPKKQLFPFVKKDMYRKVSPQNDVHQFMDLIKQYPADPVENAARWDDLAALVYTGGTTGLPKAAMLTHANISSVIQLFTVWFPDLKRGGREKILGLYPIFHAAGINVSQNLTIWNGWTSIMVPRPGPEMTLRMVKKYKPTFLPAVPSIYVGLLQMEEFRSMDLSFIKGFFAGAAPLPEEAIRRIRELHGAMIHNVYGATENVAFVTSTPWHGVDKPSTVGVPLPNTDIKIVDLDTGTQEVSTGQEGEICIKGPQVMMGYYGKPEETAETLRDGWFYTGDIGFLDEDGYLSVVDRKKDMIISRGFNIYPCEIDDILLQHPKIVEACAIGVPHEYHGEIVKAYVVTKAGETLEEEEVIAYCREKLAAYKVPVTVEFIDVLPKTTIGKISRLEVRKLNRKRGESSE